MSIIVNIADIFISNQSTFINTRINEKYHGQSLVPHQFFYNKQNCKSRSDFLILTALPSPSQSPPISTSPGLFRFRNTILSKFPAILLTIVFLLINLNVLLELQGSLNIDEYVSNGTIIEAQHQSKIARSKGESPKNSMDKLMMNAPVIKPRMGYRLKTPGGHYAHYYESERGEPFLLDSAGNLWIWEGIDPENPKNDWLVRNPEGEIYNYSINSLGKIRQKFIGNEKELKIVLNSNLGNIIGFTSEEFNDLHYREIPYYSLKPKMDCKNGKTQYLPPALLEEGFVEFKEKDRHPFKFPSNEFGKESNHKKIESVISDKTTKFQISSNSFLDTYETEETDIIHKLQREGRINSDEARDLRLDLLDEIEEEALTTTGGIDVNNLDSVLKSYPKRNN